LPPSPPHLPLPRGVHVAHEELVHLGGMVPLHRRRESFSWPSASPPLLRFSFSRRGDGFPLARGRGCVRFFPPRPGRAGRRRFRFGRRDRGFGWDLGASRRFKIGCRDGGFSLWSGLAAACRRAVASPPVSVSVCVGIAGVVSVSVRLKWARETGDFTQPLPPIGGGGGVWSQTAVAGEDRANGMVCGWAAGVGPNGSCCENFFMFLPPTTTSTGRRLLHMRKGDAARLPCGKSFRDPVGK
jgi:hypothetical protein